MAIENFLNALLYFAVSSVLMLAMVRIFFWVTPYNDAEEIHQGNAAVGITLFSQMVGLGIILWSAISHNDTLAETIVWGVFGSLLMMGSYLIFEWLTPKLPVREELRKGNMAVAWIVAGIFIALGLVVAACIS
ncbi:DUF350 domain-containing protein [Heliobacterium chlorum]|uniref:DUF350 domain-containing protein n=1 Tax=Heliobacterium chlorum TaxID=2698 RepID=A0ABR7T0K8_HELCL|nr:DUF350 domain-containing protein [Heliobacterium chlorum]MBC9783637.1 DUF350 domain-containing protein [Heliobacterium chlorum]